MSQLTSRSFGLLIAYVIPGFLALCSMAPHVPVVFGWLVTDAAHQPSVAGLLYVTLASLALGLTVSTVRWLLLDRLHHATGLAQPAWNFARLEEHAQAFQLAVEQHYRYYQFYGNTLVASTISLFAFWPPTRWISMQPWLVSLGIGAFAALFFFGSRDALRKYYGRAVALLDTPNSRRPHMNCPTLTNGTKHKTSSTREKTSRKGPAKRWEKSRPRRRK